jgi:hypothetical protein
MISPASLAAFSAAPDVARVAVPSPAVRLADAQSGAPSATPRPPAGQPSPGTSAGPSTPGQALPRGSLLDLSV